MYMRLVVALIGAAAVTGAMLLGMSEVAEMFRYRDTTRYFQVTDIIPRVNRGRPVRPEDARLRPGLAAHEYSAPAEEISLEGPTEPGIDAPDLALEPPELDPAAPKE